MPGSPTTPCEPCMPSGLGTLVGATCKEYRKEYCCSTTVVTSLSITSPGSVTIRVTSTSAVTNNVLSLLWDNEGSSSPPNPLVADQTDTVATRASAATVPPAKVGFQKVPLRGKQLATDSRKTEGVLLLSQLAFQPLPQVARGTEVIPLVSVVFPEFLFQPWVLFVITRHFLVPLRHRVLQAGT